MTPLEIALHYVSTGWPVFPCRPGDEDTMDPATGELRMQPAKSPYTSNGLRGATKFERIAKRWWSDNPEAMIGVPTGAPIGAWVLDIDLPGGKHEHDGQAWLDDMIALHGPLPETRMARTAGGGTHYFWRHKEGVRNRAAMAPGVDTRGDGGYIVAPGSQLVTGELYEWLNDSAIVDAPEWLLEVVLPKQAPASVTQPFAFASQGNDAYVNGAVDAELADLAGAAKGGRGFKLNQSAFSLGTLVGAGALSRGDAEQGLYAAAVSNGLVATDGDREVRAKIRRGLEAGIKQPRDIPEPDYQHDNTRLIDITRMLDNARRKNTERAVSKQGSANVPDREDSAPAPAEEDENIPIGSAADASPGGDTAPDDPFFATPFKWIDPKTIERREFAFGTHYIRKYVSVTVSPGGLGKTSNSIVEALAMASGKALNGTKPPHRLKVWLFNAEDPRDEMERRIMAACLYFNLKPADIEGYLFLDSGREQELIIMQEDKKTGLKINEPVVESMVTQIERYGIDVLIIDPFVSTHQVNENDNGAIDKVAKLWAKIADYTNCAVDVVHHLRKLADKEATVEDARGAVSLIGAARSVRVLNRMSEEQATKANVPPDDRFSYFWIHHGKANLTRADNSQHWRKLESVPLGNGRGLSKPQDFAGVVTEWKWPSKSDIAETVPADVKQAVIVRLANESCRESAQSDDWAGYVLADAMGVHLETGRAMTAEKRKMKSVLDSWIENGILSIVDEADPKHIGRKIKFVRPTEGIQTNA